MISAMVTKLKTVFFHKKSLKIRKVQSQSINRRRTGNTMAKGKNNKRTNNDLQNTAQKTKGRASRTPLKTGCERR